MPENRIWAVVPDTEKDALCFVSRAANLADAKGTGCRAWILRNRPGDTERLAGAGAAAVTAVPADPEDCNWEAAVRRCLAAAAEDGKPEAILFLSSVFARTVAPGLAAMLNTGITADCTDLFWNESGDLVQSRPTFGGRMQAEIVTRTRPVIATVRRGVMRDVFRGTKTEFPRQEVRVPEAEDLFRILSSAETDPSGDLGRAEIIFSGGAGMGSREGFGRLYELAEKYGGAVAASREAVATGYASYSHQVGQTGITVHPKLYVAFGISGAVQHLSGMIDSEVIAAVNPDEKAPIHKYSDYSVYADANEVIRLLLER